MRLIKTSIILLIAVLIIVSCTPTEMTPMVEISPTPLLSQITSTPLPTLSPIRTKTPFPLNTLTVREKQNFILESLVSNSSCKFPCWLGITPGETTLLEVEELLRYIGVLFDSKGVQGDTPNATLHGTYGFYFKNITNDIYFEVIDKVVNTILIRSYTYESPEEFQAFWKNYSLKNILKEYGFPDRILLNVTDAYNFGRAYHLWVFYDNKKIMVRYNGGAFDKPILRICPVIEGMNQIDIYLESPSTSLPLDRFDAILEDIRLQTETGKTRGLHTIQEATGMNEEEFYSLFMQDEELICFETPSDIWDIKQ